MSFDILVPSLPESVADATLVIWHKRPGDWVDAGENLADLETDKVVLEVPAPASGVLTEILLNAGETVVGGELLAKLDIQKQTKASSTPSHKEEPVLSSTPPDVQTQTTTSNKPTNKEEPLLSPSVRKLVAENDINPSDIAGSGKHGRILKTDVLDYLNEQQTSPEEPTPSIDVSQAPLSATAVASLRPEQRVPMTRLRAKVAERLLQAQQNAAMLTTFNEVNLKAVIDLRNQ